MEFTVDNNLTKYSKKYLTKRGNRRELSIGKRMEKTMEFSAINNLETTVEPLYGGQRWFSEKVSTIERCRL